MKEMIYMINDEFKNESLNIVKSRSCVYDLHYHLVWVTKYREHAFNNSKIQIAIKHKLMNVAKQNDIHIEALEVMPNHIHMLVSAKPKMSITNMMKKFKGSTGKWLFQTFPDEMNQHFYHGHIWSHTYYAGSVGNTTEAVVRHYVDTQKERPFK